jgi:hypothetical protein
MGGELIVCPSGMAGEIRGLTGNEARLLSDRQALRAGTFLDKLLSACWLATTDVGPYGFEAGAKPDWSKVLVGDRLYVLLRIRARSFGAKFAFKIQCTNGTCRQRFDHEVDVTELPMKSLSDDDKAAFSAGNRIAGVLPDGSGFTFRLLTGADESRMLRAGNNVTSFLGPLMARIYGIDGLDDQGKNRYFEQGDIGLAYGALTEMDSHDCGVETKFQVECPHCSEALDIEIPFGQGFLAPIKR